MKAVHRDISFVLAIVTFTWFAAVLGHTTNGMLTHNQIKPRASGTVSVPETLARAPLEMQRLAWLVGTWNADEKCEDTSLAFCQGTRNRRESIQVGHEGLSLSSHYEIRSRRGAPVTGNQVIEYDRKTDGYTLSGSDKSIPSPATWKATGDWDSEALSFRGTLNKGDQVLQMKLLLYDIRSDSFTMILYLGKQPSYLEPVLTAQYVRASQSASAVQGDSVENPR